MGKIEKTIGMLTGEEISELAGDGNDLGVTLDSAAQKRITDGVLRRAGFAASKKAAPARKDIFMKKLKKWQKITALAACLCLAVGAVFGTMGALGVFGGSEIKVPNNGIRSELMGMNMMQNSVRADAEGTAYSFDVSVDDREDKAEFLKYFESYGIEAKVVTADGAEIIRISATREELLSLVAPDGKLLFFIKTGTQSGDPDRRY